MALCGIMPHNATNQKSYDIISYHDFASHPINHPIKRQTLADSIASSVNVPALFILILENNTHYILLSSDAQDLNYMYNKHSQVATGSALT